MTMRAITPENRITPTVAINANAVCTQGCTSHPNACGNAPARFCSSGPITGRLASDNSTKTNLTTTQVSQIGNRVNRPVRKSFWKLGREGVDARMGALYG